MSGAGAAYPEGLAVYPREPGTRARLPVRQKLHCEALAGVADPETTDTQRGECLYPGGRVVLVSRNVQHAAELDCAALKARDV